MKYIIWFIFSFILIYIFYYVFFIKKTRRNIKTPVEAQYLIALYKLDVNKFSYYNFIKVVGLVTSLDIAFVATIVAKVGGVVWQILFGFVVVVPVIVISFMLLGKYYQKKQLCDNTEELRKEKEYFDKLNSRKKNKNKKKKVKEGK